MEDLEPATRVGWVLLNRLDLETGEMPDKLRSLDGERVRIPGYVVPLEDEIGRASEFLLAPYSGACIHSPAPAANQIIQVLMRGAPAEFDVERCYWIEGRLKIEDADSPYGPVSYRVEGDALTPYADGE